MNKNQARIAWWMTILMSVFAILVGLTLIDDHGRDRRTGEYILGLFFAIAIPIILIMGLAFIRSGRNKKNIICKATTTGKWDKPYWVKRKAFLKCLDREDIKERRIHKIFDFYSSSWFDQSIDDGCRIFILPVFQLKNGHAFFIGGYHRASLLAKYLPSLPIALAIVSEDGSCVENGQLDNASQMKLKEIAIRRLDDDEYFELPDLPIIKL